MTRPARAAVDLAALRSNYLHARAVHDGRVAAVMKANAYGHGAARCALALADIADAIAVAFTEEAIHLRLCGVRAPILESGASATGAARWESIMGCNANAVYREPWNKGKIVGQKAPFKLKDIWALRVRLQMENRVRDLALFNLGIDSKLRGCDLVSLKVRDICHGDHVATRAVVMQHKTQRPVQFEITPAAREVLQKWIKQAGLKSEDFLFPSRMYDSPHLGTRQYARILEGWVEELGLDPADYGTHSMRRTKATLIYRRTKNLRAVQLLLGPAISVSRWTTPWKSPNKLRSDRSIF